MNDTSKVLKNAIISADIPKMVEAVMQLSLEKRASDIHIEPRRNLVQIRLRIDGDLQVLVEYPLNLHPGVVSRIKIMSNLKIDESRLPQDGRITTFVGKIEVDLRVSTLPTTMGEKIVMRVLDKSKKIPTFKEMGIVGRNYERIQQAMDQPNGILLTTGPTGSGKTTTLYSAMNYLNAPDVNILTFEDPIENQMEGLNQSQVRPDIGYSFANGLRTALRQDPDIIMVGEIRDKETVDIAIEASLTGHLVLSTIHTNSAVETITRILNMKVQDFLLTATINLIIAQRLAKKLCSNCKEAHPPSKGALKRIQQAFRIFTEYEGFNLDLLNEPVMYEPKPGGCDQCEGQGYKGRIGIFEVLYMSNAIKTAIMEGQSSLQIQDLSQREGMVTLEQDGLIKALQGETSFEEVYKLVKNTEES